MDRSRCGKGLVKQKPVEFGTFSFAKRRIWQHNNLSTSKSVTLGSSDNQTQHSCKVFQSGFKMTVCP